MAGRKAALLWILRFTGMSGMKMTGWGTWFMDCRKAGWKAALREQAGWKPALLMADAGLDSFSMVFGDYLQ
jgi:hypothetical protein